MRTAPRQRSQNASFAYLWPSQVNIAILATLPLADVQVYVQREPEIARKLAAKSPKLYDVGPVQLMTSGLQLSRGKRLPRWCRVVRKSKRCYEDPMRYGRGWGCRAPGF